MEAVKLHEWQLQCVRGWVRAGALPAPLAGSVVTCRAAASRPHPCVPRLPPTRTRASPPPSCPSQGMVTRKDLLGYRLDEAVKRARSGGPPASQPTLESPLTSPRMPLAPEATPDRF